MQVNILSRQAAIAFCKEKHDYESAIISISDPYTEYDSEPFADSDNNCCGLLFSVYTQLYENGALQTII
jgi:hypothetical protein